VGRWDHILDQKRRDLADYVLDQIADALVQDMSEFPPRGLEWIDEGVRGRYADALARKSAPPLETVRVACELAREDMLREYELIDAFCRSPRFRELLPDALEQQTAHFLTRYLVDSALSFQEHGKDKFKRRDLVSLIEKIEQRLLQGNRLRL
jgi:AcrR family transcriptional regulator